MLSGIAMSFALSLLSAQWGRQLSKAVNSTQQQLTLAGLQRSISAAREMSTSSEFHRGFAGSA
jgi:hypothetical protein